MEARAEAATLADLPRVAAALRGDSVALVDGSRRTTFAELDATSSRVAQGLLAQGLLPGARVACLARDSDRAVSLLFGSAKANTVWMGINWRLAPPEVRYILEHAGAEILFVGAEFAATVEALRAQLPALRTIVSLDGALCGWPGFDAWLDAQAADDPRLAADPEDVVVQMYTSGTTGHPKGVQLAHRSFFAVVAALRAADDPWIEWSEHDVSLHNIPLFHIGGLWWAMTTLAAGARLVIMDSFAAHAAIELIEQQRVTKACMVPAMLAVVLAEPACAEADFGSLQYLVYGGSPIPAPLLASAMAVLGCRFVQIYGLTETGNTAVCLRAADHLDPASPRLKAAGRPYPTVALRVIDEHGSALPAGAIGEVCIRSPANMRGYAGDPAATAATLVDGWVHTGDAGFLDDDGYLTICDRVKDMIICAGENVYPAEVESVLCGHPEVAEAAVIGVPDERWGEVVKALVVRRPGASVTARQLLAHARGQIAAFKLPRSVDFVDTLPRTPSGKLQKAKLREPYWRGRDRQVN